MAPDVEMPQLVLIQEAEVSETPIPYMSDVSKTIKRGLAITVMKSTFLGSCSQSPGMFSDANPKTKEGLMMI